MAGLMRCAAVLAGLVSGVCAASAEFRIERDNGGQIGSYLQKFQQVRDSGQRVVIDGPCFSACTLALAVIPPSRICVTPNAVLGFHAAWTTDTYGHTVASPAGKRLLMESYPPQIKSLDRAAGRPERKHDPPARARAGSDLPPLWLTGPLPHPAD